MRLTTIAEGSRKADHHPTNPCRTSRLRPGLDRLRLINK